MSSKALDSEKQPKRAVKSPDSKPRASRFLYERVQQNTLTAFGISRTLHRSETSFQTVEICESLDHGKLLLLDGELQSASTDEFIYHEALVHPAAVRCRVPDSALILGGGEGGTLRELLRIPDLKRAVMVDIDGEVVDLCKKYLPEQGQEAFRDPRSELVIGDAQNYLKNTTEKYDLIISDLTEPKHQDLSTSLFSAETFTQVRSKLKAGGVFALQASQGSLNCLDSHLSITKNLRRVFTKVQTLLVHIPSFACHWCFALATLDGNLEPTVETIDQTLEERKVQGLRFYDGETDLRLRSLPRYLREALKAL